MKMLYLLSRSEFHQEVLDAVHAQSFLGVRGRRKGTQHLLHGIGPAEFLPDSLCDLGERYDPALGNSQPVEDFHQSLPLGGFGRLYRVPRLGLRLRKRLSQRFRQFCARLPSDRELICNLLGELAGGTNLSDVLRLQLIYPGNTFPQRTLETGEFRDEVLELALQPSLDFRRQLVQHLCLLFVLLSEPKQIPLASSARPAP